jgi:succinate dehydrogenase/fumarate reductase flavoprotein subunit
MTGAEVHEKLQMDEITLRHTLQSYECAASNSDSAKAEDRCADEFGKRTFPVALWPFSADEHTTYYVARMTPVVHYTMGGLKTDCDAAVLRELKEHDDGRFQQVKGLFAAGEVAGGVHGSNRLAGNSLLECVVFGRTAGAAAAQVCS